MIEWPNPSTTHAQSEGSFNWPEMDPGGVESVGPQMTIFSMVSKSVKKFLHEEDN